MAPQGEKQPATPGPLPGLFAGARATSAAIAAVLLSGMIGGASAASVTLTPGQTGTLGDATVTLLRVQDNRCPINAICIRAGELYVSVMFTEKGRTRFVKLQWPELANTGLPASLRIQEVPGRMEGSRRLLPVTFTDEPR